MRGFNTREEIALAEAWRRVFSTVAWLRLFANASVEEAFMDLTAQYRHGLSDLMTCVRLNLSRHPDCVVVVTDITSPKEIAR